MQSAAELRVKRAADLGLPWPKKPRGVGRPSDTFLWQEQLHKAIDRDDLREGLTAQPPPWWKPGKPLTRPVEEVIEMLMGDDKRDGEVVPGARAGDSGGAEEPKHEPGEEPDGQDEDQPGKRPHVVVDNDVKEWFLGFKELMRNRNGRGLAQCFRYAALLAPELFAGMHRDTPRKWKLRVARGRGCTPWQAACLAS